MSENKLSDIKKIAGVVILYNPEYSVITNINSYLEQISCLFVIDNSEKQALFLKDALCNNPKVEYIFNNANLGVASALNIALEKAIKAGYSFLLTMDQDSYFEEGSLTNLINSITDTSNVGIYSPFHKNLFFTNPPANDKPEEVQDAMTSGNILNLSVVVKIGNFKEEYFIDFVDIEYCFRLREKGFKIIRVNNSFLVHNEANLAKREVFWLTIYPPNHSATRWYYKIRNYLYLKSEYGELLKEYFKIENRDMFNNILKVLFFEKEKIRKVNMMLKGYIHYKKNIFGKLPS